MRLLIEAVVLANGSLYQAMRRPISEKTNPKRDCVICFNCREMKDGTAETASLARTEQAICCPYLSILFYTSDKDRGQKAILKFRVGHHHQFGIGSVCFSLRSLPVLKELFEVA
jgi:hypothetical protein